jgi:hypothetical protein
MDLLEVSDNPTWITRVASLSAQSREMFSLGAYDRLRYRYFVYGLDTQTIQQILGELVVANSNVIGAMLDPGSANTVVTGSGISSLADNFGGSPATCGTDSGRPPRVTASNGEMVAQGVNDFMAYPASSANNQLVTWWWAGFVLLDDVAATKRILRYGVTNTNSAQPTDSLEINILTNEAIQFLVHADASGAQSRTATSTAGALTNTGYVFTTVEFNGNHAAEQDRVILTFDTVIDATTFANSAGTPGTMPAALQGQPAGKDIALFNYRNDANLSPLIGKIGLQYFGKAAEPGVTRGCLTQATRINLANFRRPII